MKKGLNVSLISNFIVYKRGKNGVYQQSNLAPVLTMTTQFVEMDALIYTAFSFSFIQMVDFYKKKYC